MAAASGRPIEMFNRQSGRPLCSENEMAAMPKRKRAQRLRIQEETTSRKTSMAAESGRPVEMFNRLGGRPILRKRNGCCAKPQTSSTVKNLRKHHTARDVNGCCVVEPGRDVQSPKRATDVKKTQRSQCQTVIKLNG